MNNQATLDKATTRIRELQTIGDNWDDQGSPAPTPEFGDAAVKLLDHICRHMPDGLPDPFIYPYPDGGLQIDWEKNDHSIELEFMTPTKIIWLRCVDTGLPLDDIKSGKCEASDLTELMGLVMWCFGITDTEKDKI